MIVYIDMDDVICNYTDAYKKALKENPAIQFPQSQFDFFRKLKPINGSIESIKRLAKSSFVKVFILTAPSVKNPLCYTEKRV